MQVGLRSTVCIIILFSATLVKSQSFHVSLLTSADGLPTGLINDVVEDADGYVWLASDGGLIRYDGKKFVSLNTDRTLRFSKGRRTAGLYAITPNGILTLPSLKRISTTSIGGALIDIKSAAAENCFWVLSDKGLFYYDNRQFKPVYLKEDIGNYRHLRFNSDTTAFKMISPSGMVYDLSAYNTNLAGKHTEFSFDRIDDFIVDGSTQYIIHNSKLDIIESEGPVSLALSGLPADFSIECLLPFEESILVASEKNGIWIGRRGATGYQFAKMINGNEPHRPDELPFQNVYALRTFNNNIWVLAANGLGLLQKRPFHRISFDIPMASFEQAAFMENGIVYLGENGLFECTKTHGELSEYDCKTIDDRLPEKIQTAIAASGNRLWIATSDSRMFYLENQKHSANVDLSARGKNVFNLFADRDGNVWVCQAPTEKQITGVLKITSDLRRLEYGVEKGFKSRILSTKQSAWGQIYCVGIGEKTYLYQHNNADDTFTNISADMQFDYGENFEVHSFGIGADTTLWLGSTAGLLRYKNRAIEKIQFEDLQDSEVIAVTVAKDGAVWFSTDNKGLVRYDPQGKRQAIFDKHAGLSTNFMTYRALFQTEDGAISVGTREGFFLASSRAHQWQKTKRPVFFSVPDKPATSAREFAYKSTLHFNFGSLTHPTKTNSYKYRLIGSGDADWKPASYDSLSLKQLEAGNYLLEIIAKQPGGYTWSDPLVYTFKVNKIWYQQTASIVGFAILGGLVIAAGTRYYNRKLQREKKILERKVLERTRLISKKNEEIETQRDNLIAQKTLIEDQNNLLMNAKTELEQKVRDRTAELSHANKELMDHNVQLEQFAFMTAHNLRGPVARLLGLTAIFNDKDFADPLNREVIDRIQKSAISLDEIIADMALILDIKKGIHNTLSKINARFIFTKVLNSMMPEMSTRQIAIENKIDDDVELLGIEPYVFSVFYNVASNSMKYADVRKAPQILIESTQANEHVSIVVRDNGIGFDASRLSQKLFKPYSRLNSNVGGKGLGLYLIKLEMESMGGHVDIQSQPNVGTTVTLTFRTGAR
jgi:signal transduction histidine kinase/ligand-binding sensor domain-containing protein